ncbi:ABC transporter F family member 1 [Bienertia sinuspersici]
MVSDASKKKAAQKKAAAAAKRGAKAPTTSKAAAAAAPADVDKVADGVSGLMISDRNCTGVLCSHPLSRDVRIESLSVTFHGHDLIVDSMLELNYGRRYGLVGFKWLWEIYPSHCNRTFVSFQYLITWISIILAVVSCDEERVKLEKEVETLAAQEDGGGDRLERIYERLDALDASTAEKACC